MNVRMMRVALLAALMAVAFGADAKDWPGFRRGMGLGGWLTNYKRFNVLPEKWRMPITVGDYEHFDTFIGEADVERIAGWGFDHIRLGVDQIVLEEEPFRYRERTFRRVDAFVGWCRKHHINVVLNLHKAVGNYCDISERVSLLDDPGLQERFTALWLEIERRYHDFPEVAFELLNEVRNVDPAKWNALADRVIRAIRSRNPNRWIVVGSTSWGSPDALKDLRLWDDPHVVYSFHMYEPHDFTHQRGVLMAKQLYYNRVMPYPSGDVERYREAERLRNPGSDGGFAGVGAIDRDYLRAAMRGAHEFAVKHPELVLWNGEFGTIRHAPKADRAAYMRDVVGICREWGIPYCVWNYLSTPNDGNRFSLVDDDTREFLSQDLLDACLGESVCSDGWMLPGEEIRGVGRLPADVSCERHRSADGSDVMLRFDLRNEGTTEAVIEEGDYGFVFPFDSVFARGRKDALDAACVAHAWCGGDVAWVWAGRPNGTNRYFSAVLTEGRLSSYSLLCDSTRVSTGAYYRGSPVLNPPRLAIPPKGCVRFAFRIGESSRRPDRDLMGPLLVTADDYSPSVGQEVVVRVRMPKGVREERHRFATPGEHVVRVSEEGRETFVRFNVLEDLDAMLLRRAQFIVRHQQAGDDAGRLAGAYLIYDRRTGRTVVGNTDHNAGRERLGMGALVAMAARRSGDPELVRSLERHRAFVLRELFDAETGEVFNDVGRDNRWHRNYNYPWMGVYWLETWRLTHDLTHLRHAADALLAYYGKRGGKTQESPCLFVLETIRELEEAGRTDEAGRLRAALLSHADDILRHRGETRSVEVTVTHGGPNLRGSILAQAYELTHDVRYRGELEAELRRAGSFYALQPDARLCAQPVRHWDGFWFGGAQLYGDTFPQWLGALNGEMLWRAQHVLQRPFDALWRTNLKGLLSAFQPDGFASCAYYPFRTETFVAGKGPCAPFAPAGTRRGGFWDDWANDQDWSLCFAVRFLLESSGTRDSLTR